MFIDKFIPPGAKRINKAFLPPGAKTYDPSGVRIL
jgi:hypothetical protein